MDEWWFSKTLSCYNERLRGETRGSVSIDMEICNCGKGPHTHTFRGWIAGPRRSAGGLLISVEDGECLKFSRCPLRSAKWAKASLSIWLPWQLWLWVDGEVEALWLLIPLKRDRVWNGYACVITAGSVWAAMMENWGVFFFWVTHWFYICSQSRQGWGKLFLRHPTLGDHHGNECFMLYSDGELRYTCFILGKVNHIQELKKHPPSQYH